MRKSLVEEGHVHLSLQTFTPEDPEGLISDTEVTVWLFGLSEEDQINITNCPFCGKPLGE